MVYYPHREDCKCKSDSLPLNGEHPWYINAPEYHNCFWTYLRYNTRPHTLKEISEYLNLSFSQVTAEEKKALSKFKRKALLLNL